MQHIIATLAFVTGLLLGGCGQMGPLYESEGSAPVPEPVSQEPGITP